VTDYNATPADVIDFREAEAVAAEDSAERWAQVGDADARDGFLATAARAYVEAARQGAVCANAAAAALWGSQADRF
jgi:hypothetical protein